MYKLNENIKIERETSQIKIATVRVKRSSSNEVKKFRNANCDQNFLLISSPLVKVRFLGIIR